MKHFLNLYRLINILSLDVTAGAVVCTLFFAQILELKVRPYGLIALALTVWIIYTADHLIDANRIKQLASTSRHRFHQKYFRALQLFLILAIIVDAIQLFFIRKQVFIGGLALASVIALYFVFQRYLKFLKELIGALLYSGGVLLIPLAVKSTLLSMTQVILVLQFFLTALGNLLLFSLFDRYRDEKDKHSSFATIFGESTTKQVLIAILSINGVLTLVQMINYNFKYPIVLILMNFILLLILINKRYFEKNDYYRLLGDAVFFLPVICILT